MHIIKPILYLATFNTDSGVHVFDYKFEDDIRGKIDEPEQKLRSRRMQYMSYLIERDKFFYKVCFTN